MRVVYSLKVSDLILKAEQESLARVEIERTNAELQLEILDLRFRLEDRDLTADQKAKIATALRPFMTMPLDVVTYEKTYEILRLSNILGDVARRSGWLVNHWLTEEEAVAAKGVLVARNPHIPDLPEANDAARVLVDALNSQGIVAQYRNYQELMRLGSKMRLLSGDPGGASLR